MRASAVAPLHLRCAKLREWRVAGANLLVFCSLRTLLSFECTDLGRWTRVGGCSFSPSPLWSSGSLPTSRRLGTSSEVRSELRHGVGRNHRFWCSLLTGFSIVTTRSSAIVIEPLPARALARDDSEPDRPPRTTDNSRARELLAGLALRRRKRFSPGGSNLSRSGLRDGGSRLTALASGKRRSQHLAMSLGSVHDERHTIGFFSLRACRGRFLRRSRRGLTTARVK